MYKNLRATEGERNEDQVYVIKKVLNNMKRTIEKVPQDRKFMTEEEKQITNIVECIFNLNQLDQLRLKKRIKSFNTKPNAQQITNFFSTV